MEYTTPTIGFGFDPTDCLQHFLVVIPKNSEEDVTVYERYKWDNADEQTSELPSDKNGTVRCKITLSRTKWNEVKPDLERVLNAELKKEKKSVGHFSIGQNPVERLLGKEMMVLLWAIEVCLPVNIKKDAVRNWEGLCREERWWLYTMTNSSTGDSENNRGWRSALRYAITENPENPVRKYKPTEDEVNRPKYTKDVAAPTGYYGFGYEPSECLQHFMIVTADSRKSKNNEKAFISVYERFTWDPVTPDEQFSELPGKDGSLYNNCRLKVSVSKEKWDLVRPVIEEMFNATLKKSKRSVCHFTYRKRGKDTYTKMVPVERLLGKEMMVLLWAIEDCDISVVPTAIRNWQALSREERWWLFTMTNATTGTADNKHGWRIALKYALTDNPIDEKNEQTYLDFGDLFRATN